MAHNRKVIFSLHAQLQLKERGLTEKAVIETLARPDSVGRQNTNKFLAARLIKKRGKAYLLVVIFTETGSTTKIITAFLTSKIKKYLNLSL